MRENLQELGWFCAACATCQRPWAQDSYALCGHYGVVVSAVLAELQGCNKNKAARGREFFE